MPYELKSNHVSVAKLRFLKCNARESSKIEIVTLLQIHTFESVILFQLDATPRVACRIVSARVNYYLGETFNIKLLKIVRCKVSELGELTPDYSRGVNKLFDKKFAPRD